MTKKSKIIVGVVILLAAGAGVGAKLSSGSRKATEVRFETVSRKDLVASVTASGWIRPHKKVDVQADIMGRITDLFVHEGDLVHRGQVLLRIDQTQYEAAVARARAGVSDALAQAARANASAIQAERAYERARLLSEKDANLVSKQNVEEAETQMRVQRELASSAKYNVDMARASLSEAIDRMSKTVIRAPMDGIITRLKVEEGETAIVGTMNNPGSLLLTVSDMSYMEAVVRVDETDVPNLALGDSAAIDIDAFPHQKFWGKVSEISHSAIRPQEAAAESGAQGQAVDFEVVLRLVNPPQTLRPDLSANADIVTATRKNVLTIPIIALTVREKGNVKPLPSEDRKANEAGEEITRKRTNDQEGVFLVREGKAHFVPVTVGIAGKEYFEVTAGVKDGDSLVAGPYEAIRSLEENKAVKKIKEKKKGFGLHVEAQ